LVPRGPPNQTKTWCLFNTTMIMEMPVTVLLSERHTSARTR